MWFLNHRAAARATIPTALVKTASIAYGCAGLISSVKEGSCLSRELLLGSRCCETDSTAQSVYFDIIIVCTSIVHNMDAMHFDTEYYCNYSYNIDINNL